MNRKLWYNSWTEKYIEGLPIGNGRLASMVLGRPEKLRIALNHEWLWRGENRFREFPDMSEHLQEIREALLVGDFLKGTTLANEYLGGCGGISNVKCRVDPYQPAGDVWIETDAGDAVDYRRSLDLNTGLVQTSFTASSGKIIEKLFVSCTDGCIVAQVTSENPTDFTVVLSRICDPNCTIIYETLTQGLTMKGAFKNGIAFEACVRIDTDGSYFVEENGIRIVDATNLVVFIQVGTDAKGNLPADEMTWPEEKNFDVLFARHAKKFITLRGEAEVELDIPNADDIPTDERIKQFRDGKDTALPLLYFEYGRYLMVSGSSGELPLNLQGKWNEELQPPWESDYHLDINLQMCYWFTEVLGMEHASATLFNLIERYVPYGRVMAKHLYGCRGFTFSIQTDVWGRVTPESQGWAVWIGAAPWLGQHMFMHWRHTKNIDFLRNRCYPYLKECAAFYEDYLVERDGQLWILPSQSPENRFAGTGRWPVSIGINSAMDVELVTELLRSAVECAQVLCVDEDKVAQWNDILARLPRLTVDSIGRLNEWDKEREEVEPGHRHLSHLYGLYPSQLFESGGYEWNAAERSLDERLSHGGGHTGWSRSWVACLMARLGRPDDVWHHFISLISSFATVSLLDLHPPKIFQIDGNMGGTACVCEMLMQSRRGELRLLPALPAVWPKGRVKNFRAQDGLSVSFSWENGDLKDCTLLPSESQELRVVFGNQSKTIRLEANVPYVLTEF
ncbi:MAG: glycoside hydrolase family 95 protein [Clostridia bacterium]|nr:glycoside hydrolase family 95 protein [Clostridia bacterium]